MSTFCKNRALQEEVVSSFSFTATITHRAGSIFEIMTKFMLVQMTDF